jgi:hypothetical protein
MLLVPRQLQRAGMTGNVPYYGGRFTPAQAYAAQHPTWRPQPGPAASGTATRAPLPEAATPRPDPAEALQNLLDTGVLTRDEYDDLRSRITT